MAKKAVVSVVEGPQVIAEAQEQPWVSVSVVDEVPEQIRPDRGSVYLELLEKVPAEGALMIEFESRKVATQRAATIRGLAKRRGVGGEFVIASRGANVYVARKVEGTEEAPE